MAFQTWQVGLDIQNGQLCAIGIQRRRNGWQLRHWWQHTLPHDTLRNGLVQRQENLIAVLQQWQRLLPAKISLRVGFPPQLAMQRQLSLPPISLRGAGYHNYIQAAAKRLFPIDPQTLAMDFRTDKHSANQLTLTATRKEALHNWLQCLQQAGRVPQVVDLTPSALSVLSPVLGLEPDVTLVHRLHDHWLWYSPRQREHAWGWCPLDEAETFSLLQQRYLSAESVVHYSSVLGELPPEGTQALSPFTALRFLQPPLPAAESMYTLALGLALRPEDR